MKTDEILKQLEKKIEDASYGEPTEFEYDYDENNKVLNMEFAQDVVKEAISLTKADDLKNFKEFIKKALIKYDIKEKILEDLKSIWEKW